MSDPDYSPEMAGRLPSSRRRSRRAARSSSVLVDRARHRAGATVNPLALLHDMSAWYVIGEDLEDESRRKKFRVSRIRSDIRFATRRERDFRFPGDFDDRRLPRQAAVAGRRADRHRPRRGARGHGVVGARGRCRTRARSRRACSRRRTRASSRSRRGFCGRTAVRCRSSPSGCARRSRQRSSASSSATAATASPRVRPQAGDPAIAPERLPDRSRPSASASSRRFSRTCSPPAAR